MTATENLSELILFNPLKHHLDFIRKYIRAYKQKDHQQLQSFVHIHPARYSKHTIRIKATTLKSIIAAKIVLRNTSSIGLSEMNTIRVKYLHLSPVKSLGTNTFNLLKMLSFVEQ